MELHMLERVHGIVMNKILEWRLRRQVVPEFAERMFFIKMMPDLSINRFHMMHA